LAPTDVAQVQSLANLSVMRVSGLGYANILFNIANGAIAKNPFGTDKRVRQAFELAIDRDAINQVVFNGLYAPNNQPFPPISPYYDKALTIPKRDVAGARALLQQAGVATPVAVELVVPSDSLTQQVAQIVQAMAAEAGFDVHLRVTEFATMLQEQVAGNYQASMDQWSGRIDPDGNIYAFVTCHGSFNFTGYCNEDVDRLLNTARTVSDRAFC
jgi:peptide/nickel transport system substrate-binding protein